MLAAMCAGAWISIRQPALRPLPSVTTDSIMFTTARVTSSGSTRSPAGGASTRMKLTGRRLFLFTPIHHHFERLGWAETQITFRFWVIGAIGGILGIVTFLATRGVGV